MPKLVDHAERRRAILESTWHLIAERGIDNVTMRDIAEASDYATPGALNYYFAGKDQLLLAAYQLICDRTEERIHRVTAGGRGLDALLGACLEIVPADPLTVTEARVALAFWQRAQTVEQLRTVGRRALVTWRGIVLELLTQAQLDGECRPLEDAELVAEELLNLMMGLHVTSMLDPDSASGSRQRHLVATAIRRLTLDRR